MKIKALFLFLTVKNIRIKNFFRMMRISFLLLFVFTLQLTAIETEAQHAMVTMNSHTVSIKQLIHEIEQQTDYLVVYSNREIDTQREVRFRSKSDKVSSYLDEAFGTTDIGYEFENNYIVLVRKKMLGKTASSVTQQDSRRITGTVVDAVTGEPVIGANVAVKGTTIGTISDSDGRFTFDAPASATLIVSYIGYLTIEVESSSSPMQIRLQEDTRSLEEVVVIGYGTVKKVDLAGSVGVMDHKSFRDQHLSDLSNGLQGRVSGVSVQKNGQPGSSAKIRIRGVNSVYRNNAPLYVVDGLVRENGETGIAPEDIESVQILKDASSTAIYGSRGANGVILITTRKGKANQQNISFDARMGFSNLVKKYEMLTPYQSALAYRDIKNPNAFTDAEMEGYKNGTKGIDWQDVFFGTGMTQDYKITISKGSQHTQYYVSGRYNSEQGIVENNKSDKYQFKFNLTSELTPWLHMTADIMADHSDFTGSWFSTGPNPMFKALNYSPTMEMQDKNGKYNWDPYNNIEANPMGEIRQAPSDSKANRMTGHVDLRFTILPGLTFTTTNGVDYFDGKTYSFGPTTVYRQSWASNTDHSRLMLQTINNLTYTGKWDKHSLTASAIFEATSSETRMMNISGNNLPVESVGYWNINLAGSKSLRNDYSKRTLLSGIGRIIYNYADRYILTGTFRADGSSVFTNNKWGYFPSVAAAWNIANEGFMKDQSVFRQFKLRSSYGIVGSQALNPYETLGLLWEANTAFGTTSQQTGYYAGIFATPDLTWEKTLQWDLGVDFSVLDDRLSFSLDYYDKRTKDGLLRKHIPSYNGGGDYWVNDGEVHNKGFEASVSARLIQNSDWNWTSTLNGTWLKNEVLSLGGERFIFGNTLWGGFVNEVSLVKVGEPLGLLYGYVWEGLDENGCNKFKDVNGNNKLDSEDRQIIGNSLPDFTLGWNNQINWKNWELNLFFNGQFGMDKINLTRFAMSTMTGPSRFITLKEAYENNYDKVGAGAAYSSLKNASNRNYGNSSQWVEDASYLRLENITLSYKLPKRVVRFADLRFSLSCQNAFTITRYSGMDPANVSAGPNADVDNGIDMGTFPSPRTFLVGIHANF